MKSVIHLLKKKKSKASSLLFEHLMNHLLISKINVRYLALLFTATIFGQTVHLITQLVVSLNLDNLVVLESSLSLWMKKRLLDP